MEQQYCTTINKRKRSPYPDMERDTYIKGCRNSITELKKLKLSNQAQSVTIFILGYMKYCCVQSCIMEQLGYIFRNTLLAMKCAVQRSQGSPWNASIPTGVQFESQLFYFQSNSLSMCLGAAHDISKITEPGTNAGEQVAPDFGLTLAVTVTGE